MPDTKVVFEESQAGLNSTKLKTIADKADIIVNGYAFTHLYFTSFCVVECMHVHASDSKLTEGGSAKFFVKSTGDAVLQNRGVLNDREIARISEFIKDHYQEMYLRWSQYSSKGYYEK